MKVIEIVCNIFLGIAVCLAVFAIGLLVALYGFHLNGHCYHH